MASPVVQQVVENSTPTAGTSHTINLPTATANQLLLIILDKGSTSATVNAHSELTELLDEASANGLYIAYRWMNGSEPASYTLTTSASTRSASFAYRISGAENPATQAPQIGTTSSGTSATPDPPASATPGSSKDFLFIAFYGAAGEEADDDTWSDTPPTNYTPSPPRTKSCGVAGTNLGGLIAAAERALTTAAAENPGTFAKDTSAAWRAQTIMIHPASSQQFTKDLGTNALSFSGVPVRLTSAGRAGALSFSGAAVKQTGKVLVGAVSFAGTVARLIARALAGALSFAGVLAASKLVFKSVEGALSFAGDATRATARSLDGALSFAGTAARSTARAISGALSFAGALAPQARKALTGALSFAGGVVTASVFGKVLTGALSFVGSGSLRTGKAIAGALSFGGELVRRSEKSLSAVLSFTGAVGKGMFKTITGALSFAGNYARTWMSSSGAEKSLGGKKKPTIAE